MSPSLQDSLQIAILRNNRKQQRITHVIATDLTVYCLVTFTTPRLSLGRRGRQSSAYRLRYHSLWLLHFAFPEQICRHNVAVHETINLILCRARTAQRKLLWEIPTRLDHHATRSDQSH